MAIDCGIHRVVSGGITATYNCAPGCLAGIHLGGIKTKIAKAVRYGDNMASVFGDKSEADRKAAFEELFLYTPESAARTILREVRKNSRRVLVGPDAHVIDLMARLMPSNYQRLVIGAPSGRCASCGAGASAARFCEGRESLPTAGLHLSQ